MRRTLTMLVALALAGAPAVAQGHHGAGADSSRGTSMMQGAPGMMQGGMMQMMHGQGGLMMGMAMGPDMILRLRDSLELTEDQVGQLETLRDSVRSPLRQHMVQGTVGMHAASELLTSDSPDLDAYATRLREAASHMVQAHVAMARAAVEARQVLTPEQRERLSQARQMMHELAPGMMRGDMMEGGMMNHGGGNGPGG